MANVLNIMSKAKLTKTLPTDRIGFAKQQEVILGYSAAYEKAGNSAVSNEDVAPLVKMKPSTVALMNAFLLDVGFISRSETGKFVPTGDLLSFSKAMQFDASKAWMKLSSALAKTWFAQEILARAKMKELEESDAIMCLAECSGAGVAHTAQLKTLLDYLVLVKLIVRNGSKIKLGGAESASSEAGKGKNDKPPQVPPLQFGSTSMSPSMREIMMAKVPSYDPNWPDDMKAKWFVWFDQLMKPPEEETS